MEQPRASGLPEPEIKALTPADDLDAELDLAERSSGTKALDAAFTAAPDVLDSF
jgi:hypothetical protein